MELKTYATDDELFADLRATSLNSAEEFKRHLPGSRNIDLELSYTPLVKATLTKAKRDHYGVPVREVKVFGQCEAFKQPHDFVTQVFYMDGTSCLFILPFTATCDTNYRGEVQGAGQATKALASLLLTASEGQLPGFHVWNALVKMELGQRLPAGERGKLYTILD